MSYREVVPWEGPGPYAPPPEPRARPHPLGMAIGAVIMALMAAALSWFGLTTLLVLVVNLTFWQAWRVALAVSAAILVLAGLGLVLVMRATFQAAIEALLNLDLNRSGTVGDVVDATPVIHSVTVTKPPEQRPIRVEVIEEADNDQGASMGRLDLDLTPELVRRLAAAILDGRTAERELAEAGISRRAWSQVRDLLLARGLLEWRSGQDKRQGVRPTPIGVAVFQSLVHLPDPRALLEG